MTGEMKDAISRGTAIRGNGTRERKEKGTMAITLTKTTLPKSKGGRTATPLDGELADALVSALKSEPMDGDRPAAYGPETDFDTEGKASGQGARYKEVVTKALGKKVSVNVYPVNGPADGKEAKPPFRWRIYIPMSVQGGTSQAS